MSSALLVRPRSISWPTAIANQKRNRCTCVLEMDRLTGLATRAVIGDGVRIALADWCHEEEDDADWGRCRTYCRKKRRKRRKTGEENTTSPISWSRWLGIQETPAEAERRKNDRLLATYFQGTYAVGHQQKWQWADVHFNFGAGYYGLLSGKIATDRHQQEIRPMDVCWSRDRYGRGGAAVRSRPQPPLS